MKLLFPGNIFAQLLSANLPAEFKQDITFSPSSVLANELEKTEDAVALIPAMDMIKHKELYVFSKIGLSFEGQLCNSYVYYDDADKSEFRNIYLLGDVSSQEVILTKILFKELYDAAVDIHLLKNEGTEGKNVIISGDLNFIDGRFAQGISLADEITENLNLPYVNYVMASASKEALEEFHNKVNSPGEIIYTSVETYNFGEGLPEISKDYIKSNISSLIVDLDQQDLEGLEQLIRLPYFHGMIESIVDVKYV